MMTAIRRRIVVATADSVTPKMAGPAIRAWQIASALSREHDVRLVTTTRCTVAQPDGFRVSAIDDRGLREAERWCDVFIFQGWVMASRPYLRDSEKIVVVDIYDPIHLEQLEQGRGERDAKRHRVMHAASAVLNEQLLRGDFFICASDKQRDFWLGHLATLGRVNPVTYDEDETLRSLISVVPFGISDDRPVKTRPALKGVIPGIGPDDKVILWGGGIYNWFDPLSLIRAVDGLRRRRSDVRLFFMGLRHPNPDVLEMRMAVEARRLAKQLGLTGSHVFFNEDWVAYDDRQNFLLEADVGVSTHLDHLETAYSFRTRVLDYLWASLPIVATRGDALAELIEERQLGLTVPPGDVDALEHAMSRLLDDDAFAASCRENTRAVAASFAWSEVLRPLLQFCRRPRRAPDLLVPELVSQLRGDLSVRPAEPRGVRVDVMLVRDYFRDGGLRLVLEKASGRLRRWTRRFRPDDRSTRPARLDRSKPREP